MRFGDGNVYEGEYRDGRQSGHGENLFDLYSGAGGHSRLCAQREGRGVGAVRSRRCEIENLCVFRGAQD